MQSIKIFSRTPASREWDCAFNYIFVVCITVCVLTAVIVIDKTKFTFSVEGKMSRGFWEILYSTPNKPKIKLFIFLKLSCWAGSRTLCYKTIVVFSIFSGFTLKFKFKEFWWVMIGAIPRWNGIILLPDSN